MSAAGPLDPEVRDAFEQKYGNPVLLAYGATEFAGSVCTWTLDLYREFGATKRASSGRVLPDTEVRIVDPDTGARVATGEQGILEAKIALLGPDWIRTTDLASIDADGFITIHGRADGAINRGGFKILPETVRRVLVSASGRARRVCGRRARRPPRRSAVRRVRGRAGHAGPVGGGTPGFVRKSLPSHHVPVAIIASDELPRNPAMKVSVRDVAALYDRAKR